MGDYMTRRAIPQAEPGAPMRLADASKENDMSHEPTARADFDRRLKEIDARADAARAAAKPYQEAARPFEEAIDAILDERIEFIEEQESLGVFNSRCIECESLLFEGDLVCREEDEGYYCIECAPTLGEALENNMNALTVDPDDDDLVHNIASIKARIESEGRDAKFVHPL